VLKTEYLSLPRIYLVTSFPENATPHEHAWVRKFQLSSPLGWFETLSTPDAIVEAVVESPMKGTLHHK